MASKKKRLTGAALAESRVRKQKLTDSPADHYSLPVNPGFDEPNTADKARGVDYPGAVENGQAEQGIARHVIKQLQPDNLEHWIRGQLARHSNLPEKKRAPAVARALLAAGTPNATKAQYDAMLRKVEEWQQGKYKTAKGGNALRVGMLRLKEAKFVQLGVRGMWRIIDSKTEEDVYRIFNTRVEKIADVQAALDVLRLDGVRFITTVIEIVNSDGSSGYDAYLGPAASAELLRNHELRVEVNV